RKAPEPERRGRVALRPGRDQSMGAGRHRLGAKRQRGTHDQAVAVGWKQMASVYKHRGRWYLQWTDEHGKRQRRASTARKKTEARAMVAELQPIAERRALGLDPSPAKGGGGTVAEVLWWCLQHYSAQLASHRRNLSAFRTHFEG